jgi:hypothetical protein
VIASRKYSTLDRAGADRFETRYSMLMVLIAEGKGMPDIARAPMTALMAWPTFDSLMKPRGTSGPAYLRRSQ